MVRLPFVSSLISSPSQQEAGLFKHAPLDSLTLEVHPFQSLDGLIVKVQPPKAPAESGKGGAPCDIVLVIDVSGSMQCNAPVPGKAGEQKEDYGLSVLDLTKHAARTILETLGDQDRLGIVVFSEDARVLQKLEPMNAANKKKAQANIEKMTPESSTNLWHGLLEGLKLFNSSGGSGGRVPALMVLTDGMPNHMCPAQGYVPKLRKMEQLPATIHTFGFGYSLRSGLLKSIAEIGGGNYSFIPDAGMIGTVFVHAVANLQSTFARATLRLTYPSYLQLEETMGETVEKQNPVKFEEDGHFQRQLVIPLGNIQYGQSRDIYLRYKEAGELKKLLHGQTEKEKQSVQDPPVIQAVLEYTQFTPALGRAAAQQSILDFTTTMSQAEMDYHMSRSALVSFLATTYPLRRNDEEHVPLQQIHQAKRIELETLIASIPAAQHDDPASESLMADLRGTPLSPAQDGPAQEAQGQVRLALEPAHFARWGAHYLPSLAGAHTRQVCNSFKDPGPLAYGKGSPLFAKCRDRLDAAFDALPPPRPSNPTTYRGKIRMSSYNRSSNPCFAASSVVRLASAVDGKDAPHSGVAEGQLIRIGRLRAGMSVLTPKGPREVAAVLKTRVLREVMCVVGRGVVVTPWHPVSLDATTWAFPARLPHRQVSYTGSIYSVLLRHDDDVDSHAVLVGGLWGVTLGHGLVDTMQSTDIRAHHFFGSYDKVIKSLCGLHIGANGLVVGGGVQRNPRTGLVCGFKRVSGHELSMFATMRKRVSAHRRQTGRPAVRGIMRE